MELDSFDEEELLLLRIQALKSTSKIDNKSLKNSGKSLSNCENETPVTSAEIVEDGSKGQKKMSPHFSQNDESEDENNEELLRKAALRSYQNKKNRSGDKKTQHVEIPLTLPIDDQELKLRELALITLLQKRVIKTGELIRKNTEMVQHQNITSTSRVATVERKLSLCNQTTTKQSDEGENKSPVTNMKNKKIQFEETSVASIVESKMSSDFHHFQKRVSIGSDDELSLCASDPDETNTSSEQIDDSITQIVETNRSSDEPNVSLCVPANIQCNIVSCSQINKDHVEAEIRAPNQYAQNCENVEDREEPLEQTLTGGDGNTAFTLIETETTMVDKAMEDVVELPEQTNIISSDPERSMEAGNWKSSLDEINTESSNIVNIGYDENTGNLDERNKNVESSDEPGPSGYKKPCLTIEEQISDSDESIIVITPPRKHSPIVIELSDSDQSENNTPGKQRKRKVCRVTSVRDALFKKTETHSSREDLKDVTCSICLGPFENRSFLDHCFHSFCYVCIIQWSELSRLCPLCKTNYNALVHSVTKELDYMQYVFPKEESGNKIKYEERRREYNENMADGRRFRYRSTVVDHATWALRRSERERIQREQTHTREQRKISRRLKWSATKDRRKAVYRLNMFVTKVKQRGTAKIRDIQPKFFNDNPAMKHRLVPWLLRDLNVLLGDDDENIRFVMSLILNMMSKISMESDEFKNQLKPFLFDKTDHFVAELISFASSPYDIKGYDDNVVYDVPTRCASALNRGRDVVTVTDEDAVRDILLHEVFIGGEEPITLLDAQTEQCSSQIEHATSPKGNDDIVLVESFNPSIKTHDVERKMGTSDKIVDPTNCENNGDRASSSNESNQEVSVIKKKKKSKRKIMKKKKKKKKKKHKRQKGEKSDEEEGTVVENEGKHKRQIDESSDEEEGTVGENEGKHKRQRDESSDEEEGTVGENDEKHERQRRKADKEKEEKRSSSRKRVDKIRHAGKRKIIIEDKERSEKEDDGEEEQCKRKKTKKKKSRHKHKRQKLSYDDDVGTRKHSSVRKHNTRPEDKKDKNNISRRKGDSSSDDVQTSMKCSTINSSKIKRKLEKQDNEALELKVKKAKKSHDEQKKHKKKYRQKEKRKNKHKKRRKHDGRDDLSADRSSKRSSLIKDGVALRTRAEVVHELLLIEKAISKRQEKKAKEAQRTATKAAADSTVEECAPRDEDKSKRGEEEQTYGDLIKELQDIEGRINNCRSSLQTKPCDQ